MEQFWNVPPILLGQNIGILYFICASLLLVILALAAPGRFNQLFRPGRYVKVIAILGIIFGILTVLSNILVAIAPTVSDGGTPSIRAWFNLSMLFGGFASLLLLSPLGQDAAHPRFRAFLILFALLPTIYIVGGMGGGFLLKPLR